MSGYYELVIKQLRASEFLLLRQMRGSHQIWSDGKCSMTMSTNRYSRHTANAIMRQAGMPHRF